MAQQTGNGYQLPEYLTDIFDQVSKLNATMLEVRGAELKRLLIALALQ